MFTLVCLVAVVFVPASPRAQASHDPTLERHEWGEVESVPDPENPDDPSDPHAPVPIDYRLYVPKGVTASSPAPAILAGHHGGGWRDANGPDRAGLDPTLRALIDAGFVVTTWSARGYEPSGGKGRFNSPDYEVKDVQALLDMLATVPEVLKDGPNDPRVGMVGESYGAWIQLLTAPVDRRIDALNPRWTVYDFAHDLGPNGVLRSGWTATLEAFLTVAASFTDEVHKVFREALQEGKLTDFGKEFLAVRNAKARVAEVKAPTLLVQSVSDTLTTANNAIDIYKNLSDRGVPTKLYLFCGGHTQALISDNAFGISCDPDDAHDRIPALVVNWMNTHLRGGGSRLGPPIQWELQDGTLHTTSHLPSAAAKDALEGRIKAVLVRGGDPYEGAALVATPSPDGFRIDLLAPADTVLLGVPRVTMTVTVLSPDTKPDSQGKIAVYVFSKLVDLDKTSGKFVVVDEQATPMSFFARPNVPETKTFDLAAIAWRVKDNHQLFYEVSATSTDFAASRDPSTTRVEATVRVPVSVRTALSSE